MHSQQINERTNINRIQENTNNQQKYQIHQFINRLNTVEKALEQNKLNNQQIIQQIIRSKVENSSKTTEFYIHMCEQLEKYLLLKFFKSIYE